MRKVTIRLLRLVVFVMALSLAGPTLKQTSASQINNVSVAKAPKTAAVPAPRPQAPATPVPPPVPQAPDPEPAPTPAATQPDPGDHQGLLQLAGIDPNDWAAVDWTVTVESSWNPYAQEPSTGACGLAQELPCGKSGCALGDEVCELRWMNTYVLARYGSWWGEVAFHKANNYY